jgi:GTP-binding protein HflX
MTQEISRQRLTVNLRIPQKEYKLVSEILRQGQVLAQEYEENDVLLKVAIPVPLAGKLNRYVVEA